MFKKYVVAVLLSVSVCPLAQADEDRGRVKAFMHTFVMELSRMSPYLLSEGAFASAKGKETVGTALANLDKRVQNPPKLLQTSPGFRITYSLLSDHIARTKVVFDKGEFEYARMRLNGMTSMCASCHTQTPEISPRSPLAAFTNFGANATFENAVFLFTIRQYDQALAQFDRLVRQYPKSGLSSAHIMDLYRSKLAIFARVKRNPDAGIKNLKEDLKNSKLPVDAKQNIEFWIAGFSKWKEEAKNPESLTTPELVAYVARELPPTMNRKIAPSDPQLLNLLRLSGLLYERLFSASDADATQSLLYHLAQCERSLSPLNWYSLNEIYLKECVVRYPKQKYSKKCFEAYREGMEERFGNKGMPESIKDSIEALKKYI